MKKKNYLKRILAAAMAAVLVATSVPDMGQVAASSAVDEGYGVVATVDDPHTLTRPGDTFEASPGVGSTLNAGKILVGKSVTDGIVDDTDTQEWLDLSNELTNMPEGSTKAWLPGEDNFLVTVSQSSQMYGISSKIPVPLDVVFVLDTSNSMNGRTGLMVEAANDAIASILAMNEHNRVAVVAFSSRGYGGMKNDASAAYLLSGLHHYNDGTSNQYDEAAETKHITMRDGNIYGRATDNRVGTVYRDGVNGATNIQAGILLGAKQLMEATPTQVTINDQTVKSLPILVVLSDGAPTFASAAQEWWGIDTTDPDYNTQQGRGEDGYWGNGFLAVLAASYYKEKITERYFGSTADTFNTARIYTIGVGVGDNRLAQLTLNPSERLDDNNEYARAFRNAWEQYNTTNPGTGVNAGFDVDTGSRNGYGNTKTDRYYKFYYNGENDNVLSPEPASLRYNDGYFAADTNEQIATVFKELVIEIQKRAITAPTLTNVTWGQDYSGFVTFTDPIGEYMEVKNVIGVVGDGYLYQGKTMARLAEGYDPDWESNAATSEEQAAFNDALEKALVERMSLSTPAGAATPTIDQVRSILDVVTMVESEKEVTHTVEGGKTRVFDFATYGGQLSYESDDNYSNSFVWFGKVHYPEGSTEEAANEDYDVQFIGVAPKNADSIDWLHNGGKEAEALREAAKAAGANCIVRSYFMYGTAGGSREGENSHMLHFQLRVLTSLNEPHQQYVSIKAPASLLAMQKVLIDDTDSKNLVAHYDELIPTRVIYEVGLRSDINANTVQDIVEEEYLTETLSDGTLANVNADGTINFYTNDWDRSASVDSHERALAHANFEVSANNSFYRYEQNTPLYVKDGANYVPLTTKPTAGGEYYYERTYYTWTIEADGQSVAASHTEMIRVTAPGDQSIVDAECVQDTTGEWGAVNQWCIRAGVYSDNTLTAGDDIIKSENSTGSASVVTHPVPAAAANDPKYTTWLGNNGTLVFSGIELKSVTGDDITTDTVETDVDIDGKPVKVGDVLTYTLQAVNTEADPATIVITDVIPAGTALAETGGNITASINGTAKSGVWEIDESTGTITWTLTNVPVDGVVQVSFQVEVLESAVTGIVNNQATILVGDNQYTSDIITNPVTGKQAGTSSGDPIPAEGLQIGDDIEYKIAYYNTTGEVATITVTDIVPQGTTFNGVTSHAAELIVDESTDPHTLVWVLQNIQPGASGVITFTVTIDASVEKILVDEAEVLGVENSAYYIIDPANGSDVRIDTNPTETLVDTGDLQLKKAVEGTTNTNNTFELVLRESTGKLSGTFAVSGSSKATSVEFNDQGIATLEIVAGETITITGLPDGVIITVTEKARAGYTAAYHLGGDKTAPAGNRVTIDNASVGKVFVLNTYDAADTPDISTMFTVKKTLTSPVDLVGKNFIFTAQEVDENGDVLTNAAEPLVVSATVADGETITLTFQGKSFSAAGEYYYLVTEHQGVLDGITYDTTQYLVWIHVVDDGAGHLVATVSSKMRANAQAEWPTDWSESTEMTFANSYAPEDISIVLEGTKTLNGRDMIEGEFTFVVREVSNTIGVTRDVVRYGHHDANGKITFDPIFYSLPGEYVYEITELDTTGQPYMEFDKAVKTVTVVVTSVDGVLSASIKSGSDTISFTNTYTTQDIIVTPGGTKTLTGRPMQVGEFSFEVVDENGTVKSVGSIIAKDPATDPTLAGNHGDAVKIHFTPITYTLQNMGGQSVRVFTYTIKELLPTVRAEDGITYDLSEYTFTVTVTYDESKGTLSAEMGQIIQTKNSVGEAVSIPVTEVRFANTYNPPPVEVKPGEVGLGINKVITSDSEIPDGLTFGFLVYKADEAHGLTAEGAEDPTQIIADGYVVYDGTAATAEDALVGTGSSAATKDAVSGSTYAVSFSELTFSKPGVYKAWIVEANAGAEDLHGVTYAATRYLMVIKVTHDTNAGKLVADVDYYVADTVNDPWVAANYVGGTPAAEPLEFTNDYEAKGSMVISAGKTITGRDQAAMADKFDFTLTELDANGNPTANVHVGKNDANGKIVFDTLNFAEFTGDTKTITYLMAETFGMLDGITYDKSQYHVTVELSHDGQGGIVGKIVSIVKVQDANGTKLDPAAAENQLQVTADNINGNTGIIFANEGGIYKGTNITIPLTKKLTGRPMAEGEFGFELIHVATVVNDVKDETVTPTTVATVTSVSEAMSFYREYGTGLTPDTVITYQIKEVAGSKGGVIYDQSIYEVEVTVTDEDKNGELEAAITGVKKIWDAAGNPVNETVDMSAEGTGIQFNNEYKVSSTTLVLEGTKTLIGRDVTAGEFVFEVYEIEANGTVHTEKKLVTTGTVEAGTENKALEIKFDPITYFAAGEYTYEVVERAGNRANVDYSEAKYVVKVKVEDTLEGTLKTSITSITKVADDAGQTVSETGAAIAFTNTYAPDEMNLALHLNISKVLTGRDMIADEFDFIVTEVSPNAGQVVSYGSNGAPDTNGIAAVTFGSFTVKKAGTYVYKITESTEARPNVTTDDKAITVTVVVVDDGNGKLSVESITYSDINEIDGDDQTFDNVYDPTDVSMDLIATKYLTGMPLTAGQFSFKATLEKKNAADEWQAVTDGVVIGTNDVNGLVDFETYWFTEAGEYRWTVVEDAANSAQPDGGTMNFDATTFYVYVTVTDNADIGALSIDSVTYSKNGAESAGAIVFNNVFVPTEKYKPLDAVLKTDGSKVLNGRDMIEGEFTFVVKDAQGSVVATGHNDAKGNIIFDYGKDSSGEPLTGIKFTTPGSYTYTVEEVADDSAAMTHDPAVWTVRYEVTQDAQSGELIVSDPVVILVSGSTAAETDKIVFTNTYDPADVTVVLQGYKTLIGRDLRDKEFEFHLINAAGNVVAKGYNDVNGVIRFEELTFTAVSTTEYTLVEVQKNENGLICSTKEYKVKIEVTEVMNEKEYAGRLQAVVYLFVDGAWVVCDDALSGEKAQIQFENKYHGAPTSTTVEATKEMVGRKLSVNDVFNFTLTPDSSNPAQVTINGGTNKAANDASGKIVFQITNIKEAGTYTFTMAEEAGNDDRIQYSEETITVTVVVKDNQEGQLYVEKVTYSEETPVFTNEYTPDPTDPVTPVGIKTLTNRNNGTFNFGVYEWDPATGTKKSAEPKSTGTVTITEADIPTDILFDSIGYSISSFTTDPAGQNAKEIFTYMMEEIIPTVGADPQITYDRSQYTFEVKLNYSAETGLLTAVIVDGSWKQITDKDGNTLDPAVTVGGAAFTNLYTPPEEVELNEVSTWPEIVKNVTSRDDNGEVPAGLTFGFQLIKAAEAKDPAGNTIDDGYQVDDVVGTGESQGTMGGEHTEETKITFSALTFYQPGTYQAWIVENNASETIHGVTHDNVRYLVVIEVVMEENGSLTPTVKYYSLKDGGTAGDIQDYTVLIEGENSQVEFNNIYDAKGLLNIATSKVLTNEPGSYRDLDRGMFDFTLTEVLEVGADGYPTKYGIRHTGKNTADGYVLFDTLTFINDGFVNGKKTLTYLMKETPGVIPGITYDKSEYLITVELTEQNGNITGEVIKVAKIVDATGKKLDVNHIDVIYDNAVGTQNAPVIKDGVVELNTIAAFTNVARNHTGAFVEVPVTKTLAGRNMLAEEFSFTLTHVATSVNGVAREMDPTVVDVIHVGSSDNGVAFTDMKFVREYSANVIPDTVITYHVAEVVSDKHGISYDKSVYEVKVEITDEGSDGALDAKIISVVKIKNTEGETTQIHGLAKEEISFVNQFTPDPTTTVIKATKQLTGRPMQAGEFTFVINDENGRLLAVGTNDAAGKITFVWEKQLGKGEHVLTVSEQHGNLDYVTYDTNKYQVTVIVTDADNDGILEAEVEYPEGGVVFKNTYDEPEPPKEPDEPKKPEPPAPPASNPDTGDTANIGLWLALIALSAVAILGKVVYDRKKRRAQ